MTTTLLAPIRLDHIWPRRRVSLAGTISETETISAGPSEVYRCVLAGGWGELDLLFLGRPVIAGLTVGTQCRVQGTAAAHHDRLAIWNPRYQVEP